MVTIHKVVGLPPCRKIIDLINAVWPPGFGRKDDDAKIRTMVETHNLRTDTVKYLVDGERIIGFYRCSLWPRDDPSPQQAHIYEIAILPAFRRRGLGTLLVNDLIADCAGKGLIEVLSRSFRTNVGSIHFHRSFGFTVYLEAGDSIVWSMNLVPRPGATRL